MAFRDDLLSVLSGGLPALIDDGGNRNGAAGVSQQDVVQSPPEPTNRDREPFIQTVTRNQILLGTAAIIGALALVMIARR